MNIDESMSIDEQIAALQARLFWLLVAQELQRGAVPVDGPFSYGGRPADATVH